MKKLIAMVLCILLVAGMSCGALAEGAVDKIKAAGKIVVGTEATYPPYEFLNDDGTFGGCDIFLAQKIAEALGVELEITDMAFDGIIPAVQSGQVDIGIAAFTKTPERAEVIDFSELYETSAQLLIVKAGNEEVYATKEAMAGLKVGAQLGTVQSQLVESALPDSELFELDTYPNLALETINGNIVGFVVDYEVGMAMVESSDGALAVSEFAFTAEEASFGKAAVLKQGTDDLMEIVNQVILAVLEDGSYLEAKAAATGTTEDAAE